MKKLRNSIRNRWHEIRSEFKRQAGQWSPERILGIAFGILILLLLTSLIFGWPVVLR